MEAAVDVKLGDFVEWSPGHPKLYTLDISVDKAGHTGPLDKVGLRFGMREISVKGTKFYLNGKEVKFETVLDEKSGPIPPLATVVQQKKFGIMRNLEMKYLLGMGSWFNTRQANRNP